MKTLKQNKISAGLIALAIMLCLVCAASLVACSRDAAESISVKGPQQIAVGDFDYSDFTVEVVFESGSKTEIPLEKSMLSNEDNIKFFTNGTHTLTATYGGKTCEFSLEVCLRKFEDLHFSGAVFDESLQKNVINTVYTGKSFTAEVFDNYPEGTEVYYKNGNSFVNAGSYEVTAIVSRKNYVTETLTATVNVAKAKYDMSAVKFTSSSVVYDGKEHSVAISGILPSGVSVKYVDESGLDGANKKTNAGEYKVIARFSGDSSNYEQIEDMEATLTVQKKKYDTSKLVFASDKTVYDGKAHAIEVSGCPSGVSVSYVVEKVNKITEEYTVVGSTRICDAGTYRFTANFKSGDVNYETIEPMYATLKIESADFDAAANGLVLDSIETDYDGKGHTIAIPTLPEGWEKNMAYFVKGKEDIVKEEVTESGTYTYFLALVYKNDNYNGVELTATLTINKLTYDTSNLTVTCEEKDGAMYARVNAPEGIVATDDGVEEKALEYKVTYFAEMPNDKKDNYIKDGDDAVTSVSDEGEYYVVIEFLGQDTVNYEQLSAIVAKFTAKKQSV